MSLGKKFLGKMLLGKVLLGEPKRFRIIKKIIKYQLPNVYGYVEM
jgi:hypothetical protein